MTDILALVSLFGEIFNFGFRFHQSFGEEFLLDFVEVNDDDTSIDLSLSFLLINITCFIPALRRTATSKFMNAFSTVNCMSK